MGFVGGDGMGFEKGWWVVVKTGMYFVNTTFLPDKNVLKYRL